MSGSSFSIKGTFEGQELIKGLGQVKEGLGNIDKTADDAKQSLGEMLKEKNSTSNYKRQLTSLTKEISDLIVNYRLLNEEDKNTEFGRGLAARIDELTDKASLYKDAILDAQASINETASDTANWDAVAQGIDVASSALQTFIGACGLGEDSTEALVKVLATLQTAQTATAAVIKIGNAVQKESALMRGIARAQTLAAAAATKIDTAAKGKNIIVTKGATVAQLALNAAAKANPYVLLATAIIAVGAALVVFSKKSSEAAKAEKARKEAAEEAAESVKDARGREAKAVGEVTAQYNILQREYSKLDQNDKVAWIEENASAFNNLGLKVSSVNDADQIFITQSDKVITALQARAKAEAMEEKYKEEVIKAEEKKAEIVRKTAKEGDRFSNAFGQIPQILQDAGLTIKDLQTRDLGGQGAVEYILTPEAAKKLQEYYDKQYEMAVKAADESANYWGDKLVESAETAKETAEEISGLLTNPKGGNGGSTSGSGGSSSSKTTVVDEIIEPGSLREAQKSVTDLQDQLNRMSPDNKAFEETKKKLKNAEKTVEDIKKKMGDPEPAKTLVQQYDESYKQINDIQKQYEIGEIDEETAQKQIEEVNKKLKDLGLNPIKIKLKVEDDISPEEELVEEYDKAMSKIQSLQKQYEIGVIDKTKALKEIEEVNKQLEKLGLKPIEIDLDVKVPDLKDKVDTVANAFSNLESGVGAINNVYESFKNLEDELEDAENGWESFMAVFNSVMSVINGATTILQNITTLTSIFTAVTEALTAAKSANAVATQGEAVAEEVAAASAMKSAAASAANASAKGTEAAANSAAAASGAASSMASIPFVGPVLAVAAVAAVIGAIIAASSKSNKLKKYAGGGIVSGTSLYGDMNLARVNNGEMILNNKQQENLWKFINSDNKTSSNISTVEFKIKGSTLVGAIDNYNKKRNKI